MGSPETCEKCGGVGRHVEGKRGFTRFPCPNATPTPPGAAPDAASGPKAPPRMPAPADARPMVVGGAFVKFDRPAPADDARIYPCADCGLMRSRSEGGTTFTVCDVCWDKAYPTAPAPDAGAAERALQALVEGLEMTDPALPVRRVLTSRVFTDAVAALRGTPRAKRGGDQPKAGHEAEGREGA